jgi:hypothetical protein
VRERHTIGFDRKVDLAWLDAVASRVAAGASEEEVRSYLWRLLDGAVAGNRFNSARGKTVTVLAHIWSQVPEEARTLRDRAVRLLPESPPAHRVALHWAMALATYTFFADVATTVGRLLALQGNVTLAQVTRRLVEHWGERSTMVRATQRVVRSMVQWGILKDTAERGVYEQAEPAIEAAGPLAQVLLEALLLGASSESMPLDQALRHPALFPFRLELAAHDLRRAARFRVHRQGLDTDVVGLAQNTGG